MDKTLYRKYRPKNFKEVIGQDFIKKTLSNEIIQNKLSHAYIFSGPRGVGKTSIAKIFSRAINCLNNKDGDCCNQCKNCINILSNNAIDIVELDAASNNGVNEIRGVIDNTNFLPTLLKKKIYIIDEAHMLTNQAWNALLKTIEDPPKHVIFIFATTEPAKIIPTIISRCERYNFNRLNNNQIEDMLERVCNKESIKYDKASLRLIALLSEGSLRDCLSILSQLRSFSNNLSEEIINQMFGLVNIKKKIDLIKMVTSKNINGALKLIDEFEIQGVDFYKLVYQLIEILVDMYVFKKTKSIDLLKVLTPLTINSFSISSNESLKMIDLLEKSLFDIKQNNNERFYFELAILNSISLFDFNFKDDEQFDQKKDKVVMDEKINNKSLTSISVKENKTITNNPINEPKNYDNDGIMNSVKLESIVNTFNNPNTSKKDVNNINDNNKENTNLIKTAFKVDKKKIMKIDEKPLINFDKIFSYKEINIDFNEKVKSNDHVKVQHTTTKNIDVKKQDNQVEKNISKKKTIDFDALMTDSLFSNMDNNLNNDENINIFFEKNNVENDKNKIEKNEYKQVKAVPKVKIINNKVIENNKPINNKVIENGNPSDIELLFYKIAYNNNNLIKDELNRLFEPIHGSIPKVPEEGYIIDALKILVASKNGFVFLYDNELSCKNLNLISNDQNFIQYILKKFNNPYKIIGVSKNTAKIYGEKLRQKKSMGEKFDDVNIDYLKSKINTSTSAKDIAMEIFGEELGE